MAVKLSKLHYSQEAHRRLRSRASAQAGKVQSAPKRWTYHDRVIRIQDAKGKILSKSERAKIYKSS